MPVFQINEFKAFRKHAHGMKDNLIKHSSSIVTEQTTYSS